MTLCPDGHEVLRVPYARGHFSLLTCAVIGEKLAIAHDMTSRQHIRYKIRSLRKIGVKTE